MRGESPFPRNYDHVSTIGQPSKFAQALAHMVAEQIGPRGKDGSLRDTTSGAETEKTIHKTQWVWHGPVVYVESVYDTLNAITDIRHRIAATIFTKSIHHAPQKEYRFAVLNEGADEETVILQISGMMRDSLKTTEHGLVRHKPVPLITGIEGEAESSNKDNATSTPTAKKATRRTKVAEREEWKLETKGQDGQVLSSEGGLRESGNGTKRSPCNRTCMAKSARSRRSANNMDKRMRSNFPLLTLWILQGSPAWTRTS